MVQDICSRAQDCENDPLADIILSTTTYVGVVLSCIGIIFTVITLVAFKSVHIWIFIVQSHAYSKIA